MKGNVKEIVEELEQGVKDLFTSEAYAEHLRFVAKFHNYSLNNNVLIAMQCPTATYVAGFNAWKKLNRCVKKGEKGIRILAPVPHRFQAVKTDKATGQPILDENGEPETETVAVVRNSFRVAYVFDISQTEGEPLPESATLAHELTGTVEEYEAMFEALKRTSAVPIGFEDIPGSCHGYYHKAEKRIAICAGMSQEQTVKTAIHEIAHGLITDDKFKRRKRKSTRDAAFMGIMRKTLMARLNTELDVPVVETKGYITKATRVERLHLPKAHVNDALAIAQGRQGFNIQAYANVARADRVYHIRPVRHHNRQLHRATILKGGIRKNNQAPTYVKGFRLFDKVLYQGIECFIWGRRATGSFLLRKLDGTKVKDGVGYKHLTLLERSSNYLIA